MKRVKLFTNSSHPLEVSGIALGCDHFGAAVPEERALRIMDAYRDLGGMFLDTAHIYSQPAPDTESLSEKALGKWLAATGTREKMVISTKGAHPDKDRGMASRMNARSIKSDIASSLETLGVGYVDIWFLHRDDPAIPAGEIVDMVSELVDLGYARHIGASNWTAERLAQAGEYAKKHGRHGFAISQIQWSLAHTTPAAWDDPTLVCMDGTQLPWYREQEMPVMAFSPQGRGIFSKLIDSGIDALPEKTVKRFLSGRNMVRAERCWRLCRKTGLNAAGIALAYLTSAPFPAIPIVGCNSPERVHDSLRFADATLSEEERSFLVSDAF